MSQTHPHIMNELVKARHEDIYKIADACKAAKRNSTRKTNVVVTIADSVLAVYKRVGSYLSDVPTTHNRPQTESTDAI